MKGKATDADSPLESYPQAKQGFITDLPRPGKADGGLQDYLYTFLDMWQSYLEPGGAFRWLVIRPASDRMIAVVFVTQSKDNDLPPLQDDENLKRVSESAWQEGRMICTVTDDEVITIIKPNERRLWTRRRAREDARATFVQAMYLQDREGQRS